MPTTAIGAASSRFACALGDASVAAAHAAMLHCGARGYLKSHRAQRRLREAYFVAIVTPATKQLRKMLAATSAKGISDRPNLQPHNRRGLP